ncbi:unnamed protein product [Pleuronectes platessa]|uniref:Uncharacterized protein n=1 Tax=Pleuronectes platessa TaxID=8262 RepID=A0A9N7YXE1_PLEPL|nr:unnamed protein product [Pleuronectes platessa]
MQKERQSGSGPGLSLANIEPFASCQFETAALSQKDAALLGFCWLMYVTARFCQAACRHSRGDAVRALSPTCPTPVREEDADGDRDASSSNNFNAPFGQAVILQWPRTSGSGPVCRGAVIRALDTFPSALSPCLSRSPPRSARILSRFTCANGTREHYALDQTDTRGSRPRAPVIGERARVKAADWLPALPLSQRGVDMNAARGGKLFKVGWSVKP